MSNKSAARTMTNIVEEYDHDDDRALYIRYETRHGKMHGIYMEFYAPEDRRKQTYPNGHLETKLTYVNGRVHGMRYDYHPNGQRRRAGFVMGNNWIGQVRVWYETGTLEVEIYMVNGKRHGICMYWNRTGDVSVYHYEHGKDVGFQGLVQRQCRWIKKELMEYVHHPDRQMRIAEAYGLRLDAYHDILD